MIGIGVDFGSTALRAAWVNSSGSVSTLAAAESYPGLLFEPSETTGLFRAAKDTLGSQDARRGEIERLVADAFRRIRRSVEEQLSGPVARIAVTVPARYSTAQRTALREAVTAAGFPEIDLLNDSLAAVLAQGAAPDQGRTYLVFCAGYSGFEAALVRATRGQYRTLGYEGGETPSGADVDLLLIQGWFNAFRHEGLSVDWRSWTPEQWAQVRVAAEGVKHALDSKPEVKFPVPLTIRERAENMYVWFDRALLAEAVTRQFKPAIESIDELLDQAHLRRDDVQQLLLVGGTAQSPMVRALLEAAVGHAPVLVDAAVLARGGAIHAARQYGVTIRSETVSMPTAGRVPTPVQTLDAKVEFSKAEPLNAGSDSRFVIQATAAAAMPQSASDLELFFRTIQNLASSGSTAEARRMLEQAIRKAQEMLAAIPAGAVPAVPTSPPGEDRQARARRALVRARNRLRDRRFEEAIHEAHLAWKECSDAETLEEMIGVHCDVATANTGFEGYPKAIRWLQCAYNHDQSSARVRRLMADRHFQQAEALAGLGKRGEANELIEACLSADPDHKRARELQVTLARR